MAPSFPKQQDREVPFNADSAINDPAENGAAEKESK